MSVAVRTVYLGRFSTPDFCVACGSAATAGASYGYTGAVTGKKLVSLKFPQCRECQAARMNRPARFIPWLGAAVLLFAGLEAGNGILFFSGLLLLILSAFLSRWINLRGRSVEQRQRKRVADRAVVISEYKEPGIIRNKSGSIIFRFANPAYATAFAMANGGEILPAGS